MKNILSKFLLPFCLIIIAVITLYTYINQGVILYTQLAVLFFIFPNALEGIKPAVSNNNLFKYFRIAMIIIGVIMMIIFGIEEM